ncbi:MAG: DUF4910 domain-containing protein [Candidatus Hodarchaeota archaeon]
MKLGDLLSKELSGKMCQRTVRDLTGFNREVATAGHLEAANYMYEIIKKIGLENASLEEFSTDGKTKYYTMFTVPFWTPKKGILKLIEPEEAVLADFNEIPCSLALRSGSTLPDGITAEVVYVGEGLRYEDYIDKDVKGKVVLAEPPLGGIHAAPQLAKEHGAIGIILNNLIQRHGKNMTRLDRLDIIGHAWMTGWYLYGPYNFSDEIFGFSISQRETLHLKKLLLEGKTLKVNAIVDAEFKDGFMPLVTGVIQGAERPEEEVVIVSHLDHPWPSANDNASGCALLAEIARVLKKIIGEEIIERPKRTIRFMWVPHIIGIPAWSSRYPDWAENVLAGFSCDMVGEDQIKCKGPLVVTRTPDSNPSYLNDLVEYYLKQIPANGRSYTELSGLARAQAGSLWKYEISPYVGGSDHAPLNDRSINAPALLFVHPIDIFYHSSWDTVDKTDPMEFEKIGWVVTMAALKIANADSEEALTIAKITTIKGLSRILSEAEKVIWILDELNNEKEKMEAIKITRDEIEKLNFILWREIEAVKSTSRLNGEDDVGSETTSLLIKDLKNEVEKIKNKMINHLEKVLGFEAVKQVEKKKELSEEEKKASSIIPIRRFDGPLLSPRQAIRDHLGLKSTEWIVNFNKLILRAAVLWTDNKKTILDISRLIEFEYGIEPNMKLLLKFYQQLEEAELVELSRAQTLGS